MASLLPLLFISENSSQQNVSRSHCLPHLDAQISLIAKRFLGQDMFLRLMEENSFEVFGLDVL